MQDMVQAECEKWSCKGVNVKYENRDNRSGYKAGALREGLQKEYVRDCKFVAIFDADFQPDDKFLWKTIPYLLENPELGLVQAKWKFGKTFDNIIFKLNIKITAIRFMVSMLNNSYISSYKLIFNLRPP